MPAESNLNEPKDGNADAANETPDIADEAMLYCPVCSQRLEQSRCKLVCPQCGYFMSCADYY